MKLRVAPLLLIPFVSNAAIQGVVSSPDGCWRELAVSPVRAMSGELLDLDAAKSAQTVTGFGCAMSELSHQALWQLPAAERAKALDGLFGADGAGFTVIRTPIGASDFALKYYSYDDHPGDFAMEKFSIANDEKTLLPLLREVQKRVSAEELKIWASPWCPPKWLKKTDRYASQKPWPDMAENGVLNDCTDAERVYEGENGFIVDEAHLKAYGLYFRKYVDAYRAAGVPIFMVMPQNEPNSAQPYPSCTWRNAALVKFIGKYLGPALEGSGVEIFFGTEERGTAEFALNALEDADAAKYVKGAGFQWAGRWALVGVHKRHPELTVYATESECGTGKNDWAEAEHTWELIKHYFDHGCSVYEYWNLALQADCMSTWGWKQNSLVIVDPAAPGGWRYSPDFYVMQHLSKYVKRGAKFLPLGEKKDAIAFRNPDGSTVLLAHNGGKTPKVLRFKAGGALYAVQLAPGALATLKSSPIL